MENIKGKIQVGDKKITLEIFDGEKEVWIKKLSPEFETGVRFVRFRGQYFFKK
jgi:hypothetical protein